MPLFHIRFRNTWKRITNRLKRTKRESDKNLNLNIAFEFYNGLPCDIWIDLENPRLGGVKFLLNAGSSTLIRAYIQDITLIFHLRGYMDDDWECGGLVHSLILSDIYHCRFAATDGHLTDLLLHTVKDGERVTTTIYSPLSLINDTGISFVYKQVLDDETTEIFHPHNANYQAFLRYNTKQLLVTLEDDHEMQLDNWTSVPLNRNATIIVGSDRHYPIETVITETNDGRAKLVTLSLYSVDYVDGLK